ncbi:MAG: OmpA family protein [Rikenellaceae bacterium]|nr:OmpA family protein [Rikenellaceae bacterium]
MKYIYTIILSLIAFTVFAQIGPVTGRIELNDGKFVIESFTIRMSGDSLHMELGDLKVMDAGSPTVQRFSVPAVFAVPLQRHQSRRRVDRSEYAGQMKVTVVEIAEQDDELFMEIEMKLDGDVMNRRLSWLVIPELIAGDSTATGAGLMVNGWGREQLYKRRYKFQDTRLLDNLPDVRIAVTTSTDTLVRYNLRMPYRMWMDDAVLDIHQVVGSPAGKEQLYTLANAGRVKLQPREPYEVQPKLSFVVPEREQKSRRMQGQAFLDFAVGRSVIVPTYRRNPEELSKIEAAIKAVQSDSDVEIVGLFVEGYASPDGSYATNERLARERSEALLDYITRNFGIPANIIRSSSVAEDWDGLRLLVEQSDIARRDDILAVIDSTGEPDRKEQRLKGFGAAWLTLRDGMFPQLRRVEYQIDFTVKDYTLEESRELADRNPEMLSQRELYLLAQSYEYGSPQWEQIFETIIRLYPDDPVSMLNYSAVLIRRGEMAAARRYLDRLEDVPDAANNTGVWYLLSGDLDTASLYLGQAREAGSEEAAHNLEELECKRENEILMERYKR